KAKEKIDGFTPEQRFFIGFAQIQCENARPEAERLKAATNPHASNKYRVNGVVSNMPEFAKAFSCKAGAPMVRQNACRVWEVGRVGRVRQVGRVGRAGASVVSGFSRTVIQERYASSSHRVHVR